MFQYRIWEIAFVTLLVALAFAFVPHMFQSKRELVFYGIVFTCGGAIRIVGWRLGRVFTLLGRHVLAWLFSVVGCAIAVLLLNAALSSRPIEYFLDELLPVTIIGGIFLGSVVEIVFLVFSILSRFVFGGAK